MDAKAIERALPLTPAAFHILVALSTGPRHGYALMKEVSAQTGGELRLGPGKLYYSIRRMLAKDWIREVEDADAGADPRRRYYRITATGSELATAEARRLERAVELARDRQLIDRAAGEQATR